MDKNIGKKLDGRYEITELIGVGGMADVYKGVDVIDNKAVAIKILKKEFAENEEFLRRFRNESKAIAVLSHPNIVKIYDVGFSDKIQYIVMEYIDGITLKDYIEEEKVLTWKDTVHFILQILRALRHAHEKGIVHRDIKPQNIMMFTDGTIKVMDFGIAKFARDEGKTATDQAIGSVHYISPEQARGDTTDAKSDIYSIGAMMYEMLTGRKPFDSENPVSIAVMHMQDIPDRPRALNPDIPPGLEEIVLRTMEKNPDDRYPSTVEMMADIEAFKNDPEIVFGYYQEVDESVYYYDQQPENYQDYGVQQGGYQSVPVGAQNGNSYSNGYGGNGGYNNGGYNNPPQKPAKRKMPDNYNDYDDDDEEEERSSLVVPVLTAAVVVVIVVAVIFVTILVGDKLKSDGGGNDFKMPYLIGKDYNDAVSEYRGKINIQENGYEYSAQFDQGCIISQSIEAGTPVKKNEEVKVVISRGTEKAKIPLGLKGLDLASAQRKLTEANFLCEVKNASSNEVEKGYVINSSPEEGTEVNAGMTVILYVSMGLESEEIIVENYVGQKIEDVSYSATYLGLHVEIDQVLSKEPVGVVVEQSIKPNERVEAGTTILLKVSKGIAPDGDVEFNIPVPQNAVGTFQIEYTVIGDDGTTNKFTSDTIIGQVSTGAQTLVSGSGEEATVKAVLISLDTTSMSARSSNIGEYKADFTTGSYQVVYERVSEAFSDVGGFIERPTEAPTTVPPTEYVPPLQIQTEPTQPEEQPEPEPEPQPQPEPQPTEPPPPPPTDPPAPPPTAPPAATYPLAEQMPTLGW